jgi:hypothetical protein
VYSDASKNELQSVICPHASACELDIVRERDLNLLQDVLYAWCNESY